MSSLPPPTDHVDLLTFDSSDWDWKAFERFCLGYVQAQSEADHAHAAIRLQGLR